jgi:cytochrome P450
MYDLLAPEVRADPYPLYAVLRAEDPVHWNDGLKAWVLTRYSDVLTALRTFSSKRAGVFANILPAAHRESMRPFTESISRWMLFMDPPDHGRLRTLLNKAFTPKIVEVLRPKVATIVRELLDEVAARGRMDVIRDLAYPLPTIVIAEMLGAPASERASFKRWSDDFAAFFGMERDALAHPEVVKRSWQEMSDLLRELVAIRRAEPREDLVSALIAAEEAGTVLADEELVATCTMLLFAGHETTTNLIGNGVRALLDRPEALATLIAEPDLMAHAVEEFLRFDSPVQTITRVCLEDTPLGGKTIRKGERVSAVLGSANRDPAQFRDPDTLDVRRRENRHLAFGYGLHFCVGAPLARLEGALAIGALLRRFEGFELQSELRYRPNLGFRALEALDVTFRASRAEI